MATKLNIATQSKLKEFFVDQLQDIYWAEKNLSRHFQNFRTLLSMHF
jgi:hypothetical protein